MGRNYAWDTKPIGQLLAELEALTPMEFQAAMGELRGRFSSLAHLQLISPARDEWSRLVEAGRAFGWGGISPASVGNFSGFEIWNDSDAGTNGAKPVDIMVFALVACSQVGGADIVANMQNAKSITLNAPVPAANLLTGRQGQSQLEQGIGGSISTVAEPALAAAVYFPFEFFRLGALGCRAVGESLPAGVLVAKLPAAKVAAERVGISIFSRVANQTLHVSARWAEIPAT